MGDLDETIGSAVEQAAVSRLHSIVAICVALAATLMALALVGCSFGGRPSFALPSGAMAIPTDPDLVNAKGTGILCTPDAIIPPVAGYLRGDATDSAWPVWIEAADGRRQYVLWPAGFSVRFTPDPELLDEQGTLALTDVVPIELQVGASPDLGTKDHPYGATGILGDRCYIHRP